MCVHSSYHSCFIDIFSILVDAVIECFIPCGRVRWRSREIYTIRVVLEEIDLKEDEINEQVLVLGRPDPFRNSRLACNTTPGTICADVLVPVERWYKGGSHGRARIEISRHADAFIYRPTIIRSLVVCPAVVQRFHVLCTDIPDCKECLVLDIRVDTHPEWIPKSIRVDFTTNCIGRCIRWNEPTRIGTTVRVGVPTCHRVRVSIRNRTVVVQSNDLSVDVIQWLRPFPFSSISGSDV
jgi:hypothetical protein